jgi:hypothetical protein
VCSAERSRSIRQNCAVGVIGCKVGVANIAFIQAAAIPTPFPSVGVILFRPNDLCFLPIKQSKMEIEHYNSSMIAPEVAMEILAKNNIKITVEEAKNLLEMLYFLVNLSVDQYVTL